MLRASDPRRAGPRPPAASSASSASSKRRRAAAGATLLALVALAGAYVLLVRIGGSGGTALVLLGAVLAFWGLTGLAYGLRLLLLED